MRTMPHRTTPRFWWLGSPHVTTLAGTPMTDYATTRDGVRIAYDREGDGTPILLVGGAMQQRATDASTRALTTELASRGFSAIHYDRPGRGGSGGDGPFTLAGEVAAAEALLDVVGGSAAVYGSSSGAAIALAAACRLGGVSSLVLWEPPLGEELDTGAESFLGRVRRTISEGDREAVIATFMEDMPPEWFSAMRGGPDWPLLEAAAPSLEADAEALAWAGSAPRSELWAAVRVPTTVLLGESAFEFFEAAAESVVASIPGATTARLPGAGHGWQAADLARAIVAAVPGHPDSPTSGS